MIRVATASMCLVFFATGCATTTRKNEHAAPTPPASAAAGDAAGGSSDAQQYDASGTPTQPGSEDHAPDMSSGEAWSPSERQARASALFLQAEYQASGGLAPNALEDFQAAYNLDPNAYLATKLIAAKIAAGNHAEALMDVKKLTLLYPRSAKLRFLHGEVLVRLGKLEESTAPLERAAQLDPGHENAHLMLVVVYQRLQRVNEAIAVAKDFFARNPASADMATQLAKLYLNGNRKKDALKFARLANDLRPAHPEAILLLAIALEANKDSAAAVRQYERLYRYDPTNEILIARMVKLYEEFGGLDDALSLIDELNRRAGGKSPGVLLQKAYILWEMKRFAEAARLLEDLHTQYPNAEQIRYLAGLGREKMEQFDRALEMYLGIPKGSEIRKVALLRAAVVLFGMKKFDDALTHLEELRTLAVDSEEPYYLSATISGEKKDFAAAVAHADAGWRATQNPKLLFLRGVYEEKQGRIDNCVATMRQVIKVDPANASAHNYLGYLFAERGSNLDEAETLIAQALRLKPDDGAYLDSLGWVTYQKKNYHKALEILQRAISLAPEEGVIMEHIGEVLYRLGRKADALSKFDQALKTTLEDRDRERIVRRRDEVKRETTPSS